VYSQESSAKKIALARHIQIDIIMSGLQPLLRSARSLGIAAVGVGVLAEYCMYDVDAGTRVVLFDQIQGVLPNVFQEGTHLKLPWQSVRKMDIRSRPRTINSTTGTKDLQVVNISLRVLYRPREDQLATIVKTLGMDYEGIVFGRTQDGQDGVGNEVLKEVVAQFNAEELLRKREIVSDRICKALKARAAHFHLVLDDVAITHLSYGREFAKAIEHKQVAQQEAERQTYVVQMAEQERRANVIRAEGDADAAKLISDAIKKSGDGLIEVRKIDTAKEVATTLAKGRGNIVYLPSGGDKGSNMLLGVDTK
jgi:prohibitin 1